MVKKSTNMVKYIIKRILMIIPMLFAVLTITWILSHAMAINPLQSEAMGWICKFIMMKWKDWG